MRPWLLIPSRSARRVERATGSACRVDAPARMSASQARCSTASRSRCEVVTPDPPCKDRLRAWEGIGISSIKFFLAGVQQSCSMRGMIGITALRTFVHVAECGTIRDAAERLFRTPSAVSMTLTQLERDLGAPLFQSDRKNRLTAL